MLEIPKLLAQDQRSNIVKHMLLGDNRDSIAEALHLSSGTVFNVWSAFKRDVNKIGLDEAVKVYNVEEVVENLRKLSLTLRDSHVTVEQSLTGSRILRLLETLRIDQKDLESFLHAFYKQARASARNRG